MYVNRSAHVVQRQVRRHARFGILVEVEATHSSSRWWRTGANRRSASSSQDARVSTATTNRDRFQLTRGGRRQQISLSTLLYAEGKRLCGRAYIASWRLRIEVHTNIVESCQRRCECLVCAIDTGDVHASARGLTSKTCTTDILYSMVRDKKSLLPPHEHGSPIAIRHGQMWPPELVLDMPESREALPMYHILLFICSPLLRQKAISIANDFCVKVCRQLGPIVGQSAYTEVPAKERGRKVDILWPMSR